MTQTIFPQPNCIPDALLIHGPFVMFGVNTGATTATALQQDQPALPSTGQQWPLKG